MYLNGFLATYFVYVLKQYRRLFTIAKESPSVTVNEVSRPRPFHKQACGTIEELSNVLPVLMS